MHTAESIALIFHQGGLKKLENALNVEINLVDLEIEGCLIKQNDQYKILINKNLPKERFLFVLFHEIYHLLKCSDHLLEVKQLYSIHEVKANAFAKRAVNFLQQISVI